MASATPLVVAALDLAVLEQRSGFAKRAPRPSRYERYVLRAELEQASVDFDGRKSARNRRTTGGTSEERLGHRPMLSA